MDESAVRAWQQIEKAVEAFVRADRPVRRLDASHATPPRMTLHRRSRTCFLSRDGQRFVGWVPQEDRRDGEGTMLTLDEGGHGILVRSTGDGSALLLPGQSAREVSRALARLHTALVVRPTASWEEEALLTRAAMDALLALGDAARRRLDGERAKGGKDDEVGRALSVIDEEVARGRTDLTVALVAARLELEPRHLARLIARRSGCGFGEHVALARVLRARMLLARGADEVSGVATACGFGSRDTLIRAFRRVFGRTPLAFRKAFRRAGAGELPWREVTGVEGVEPSALVLGGSEPGEGEAGGPFALFFVGNDLESPVVVRPVEESSREAAEVLLPGDLALFRRARHGEAFAALDARGSIIGHWRVRDDKYLGATGAAG